MTDDQIKHMVDRFLGWTLPENFNPDAGVSFKRQENRHHHPEASPFYPMPSGTNLFDATQADAMVRHMIEGMPASGIASAAKSVCDHWAEFGPEHGFDETMESLYRAVEKRP